MDHLACPRCQTPLAQHTLGEITVDGCPGCGGMLVAFPRLVRLLQTLQVDDPGGPLPRVPDKGAGLACPLCAGTMSNYGYMGASFVHLDRCPACNLVFVDDGELVAMTIHRQRTERRIDDRATSTPIKPRGTLRPHGVVPALIDWDLF